MPDQLTPDQIREHAAEILLDHARDVEFLSVVEHLAGREIDDPNDDLARQIHDLISTADITIAWPNSPVQAMDVGAADQLDTVTRERDEALQDVQSLTDDLSAVRTERDQIDAELASANQQISQAKTHFTRRCDTLTARAERAEAERDQLRQVQRLTDQLLSDVVVTLEDWLHDTTADGTPIEHLLNRIRHGLREGTAPAPGSSQHAQEPSERERVANELRAIVNDSQRMRQWEGDYAVLDRDPTSMVLSAVAEWLDREPASEPAARRTPEAADLPPIEPVPGEHYWVSGRLTSCRWCGIVRRYDRVNGPCKGRVHVELRPAVADESQASEPAGLYGKYRVERVDGRDKHGARYFVLDYVNDPYARAALAVYANVCRAELPDLAADLRAHLDGTREAYIKEQSRPKLAQGGRRNGCGPDCSEGHTYEAGCAIQPPARAFLGEPACGKPGCPCGCPCGGQS